MTGKSAASPARSAPLTSPAENRSGDGQSTSTQSQPGPAQRTAKATGNEGRTVNAWREQWRQLGLQAWSAESDGRRETQNPRALSQDLLEELKLASRQSDSDLCSWEQELWGSLAKVRKRVQVLARNMHFASNHGDIRRMVQCAEHDLRVFAEQARQEEDELAALECSLQDTLESCLTRFDAWCSQESSLKRTPEKVSKPRRPPSCSRLTEASTASQNGRQMQSMHAELDKLTADVVCDGGLTGGWTIDDHDAFMRLFQKHRRKTGPEFIGEVQQILPAKRHEELIAHVRWLLIFEERQTQKKQLVEKWRHIKAAASAQVVASEAKQELTAAAAREEKRQRASSRERQHKELNERRQLVSEWRAARDREQLQNQEEQKRRAKEAEEREASKRNRMAEQRREALAAMKEQRAAEEAMMGSHSATVRPLSAESRRRIAERKASLMQKCAMQGQARRSEVEETWFDPPPRSLSTGAAYRNVESRLDEHTQAYVERSRELSEELLISSQTPSKYGVVPGNFAHQGLIRTVRKPAAWRPQFGA